AATAAPRTCPRSPARPNEGGSGVQVGRVDAEGLRGEAPVGCLRSTYGEAMIITVDDRRGSRWPVPLVLAAVCGLLSIFGVAFLQQRALDAQIDDQQARAAALVRQVVVPATKGEALTKPLARASAARLLHDLEKGVLSN